MDVLLVNLPFYPVVFPSLGLSSLKAILMKNYINTEIIHANLIFNKQITDKLYSKISGTWITHLIPEIIFADCAFPDLKSKHEKLLEKYKELITENENIEIETIRAIIKQAATFIEKLIEIILVKNPKILGISIMFSQVCAAGAVFNKIKNKKPDIINIAGGYHTQIPMANTILKMFSSIDYIFSGESEFEFLNFCNNVLNKKILPENKLIICKHIENIDELPLPDFTDYFSQLNLETKNFRILIESARGCWKAEKNPCVFCGGLGLNCNYRAKSSDKINEELKILLKKYNCNIIYFADSIHPKNVSKSFIKNFDPPNSINLICMLVRPDISFNEIKLLRDKKITLTTAGIETFSDNLLKLLNKKIKTINNIRFMKDCKTLGMYIKWYMIYKIPGGETENNYLEIMRVISNISHLQPPSVSGPIGIQRYSIMFNNSSDYGIKNLKPLDIYYDIFPDNTDFYNFAVYFSGQYYDALNGELGKKFFNLIYKWSFLYKLSGIELILIRLSNNFYLIKDTRFYVSENIGNNKKKYTLLNIKHYFILKKLRNPFSINLFKKFLIGKNLTFIYNELLSLNYVIEINNMVLALVIEKIRIYPEYDKDPDLNNFIENKNLFDIFIDKLNSDNDFEKSFFKDPGSALNKCNIFLSKTDIDILNKQLTIL